MENTLETDKLQRKRAAWREARRKYYLAHTDRCRKAIDSWKIRNPKKAKKYSRNNYMNHREEALKRQRAWYAKNREKVIDKARTYKKNNPWYFMFCACKSRAKRSGIAFTIEPADIKIPEYCPVLGIKLIKDGGSPMDHWASLDRINSKRGYEPDNVAVISYRANRIKSDATIDEIKAIYNYMKLGIK